uniref:Protein ARV n=1 Tax=Heterorhabditis bacteriophora TaxID=37862 RepID=A0A1I7XBJ1_HETBA
MHLDESYVCISCLQPTSSLFQKYSEGVIRLTECKKCGGVVDKYVEYDTVLVVIDLIIHYLGAYRHVIYNMKSINYLRLSVIFLFCDAYDKWISGRALISSKKIYDLEWIFYESLVQSTIEISTYIGVIILFGYFRTKSMTRVQFVSTSTMLGYYAIDTLLLSYANISHAFGYSEHFTEKAKDDELIQYPLNITAFEPTTESYNTLEDAEKNFHLVLLIRTEYDLLCTSKKRKRTDGSGYRRLGFNSKRYKYRQYKTTVGSRWT